VGGNFIEVYNLQKYPFQKCETKKSLLSPLPIKLEALDEFHYFSGEAIFVSSTFETFNVLELNIADKNSRKLLDFCRASYT
jgi:hypothetical protein